MNNYWPLSDQSNTMSQRESWTILGIINLIDGLTVSDIIVEKGGGCPKQKTHVSDITFNHLSHS